MTKQRRHRVSVYILDPDRRRVLLHKAVEGPFKDKYAALSTDFVSQELPHETIKRLVQNETGLAVDLVSYGSSSPVVLDSRTVKLNAPLLVQVTHVDDKWDYVEHVFLARARQFSKNTPGLSWFNTEELIGSTAPKHVKILVREILTLVNA